MTLISKEVKELCKDMIDYPENWKQTSFTFNNIKTNMQIWTSNGILSIDFYPNSNSFNIFEKIYIKRSIGKSNLLKQLKTIKHENNIIKS